MRRIMLAGVLLVALTLCPVVFANGALPGKYQTKIAAPAQVKGTWVVNFVAGKYVVTRDGKVAIRGVYTISGNKLTLSKETGPLSCEDGGTYTWIRTGNTLALKRVKDPCAGRVGVLQKPFAHVT